MSCERSTQIQMYHDGELPTSQRAELERHLEECEPCRSLLNELRSLSSMFATVPLPELSRSAMNRLQGTWWAVRQAQDRSVRLLAEWLTAAAAIVLLLAPLRSGSPTMNDDRPVAVSPAAARWEDMVAFAPPPDSHDEANGELIQVAQWMANDLSAERAGAQ